MNVSSTGLWWGGCWRTALSIAAAGMLAGGAFGGAIALRLIVWETLTNTPVNALYLWWWAALVFPLLYVTFAGVVLGGTAALAAGMLSGIATTTILLWTDLPPHEVSRSESTAGWSAAAASTASTVLVLGTALVLNSNHNSTWESVVPYAIPGAIGTAIAWWVGRRVGRWWFSRAYPGGSQHARL